MIVLVCGDRFWPTSGRGAHANALARKLVQVEATLVVQGGAPGADTLGKKVAQVLGIPWEEERAEWRKLGKAAGPTRNRRMLARWDVGLVLALHADLGRSTGTVDMLRRARRAGVPCEVYDWRSWSRRDPPPVLF